MDGHLRTMEHFLETGAEIMQAYLGTPAPAWSTRVSRSRQRRRVRARRRTRRPPRSSTRPRTATSSTTRSDGPCPRTDPGALRASAHAARDEPRDPRRGRGRLVPGRLVTGMRDVRAYRWLAWGEAPQTLELRARRLDARRSARSRSRRAPHVEDGVAAGEPGGRGGRPPRRRLRPGAGPLIARRLSDGRPSRFAPGGVLRRGDVPRASWQAVRALELVAPAGARARGLRPCHGPAAAQPIRSPASCSTRSCSTPPAR